jgi:hypothetical protein
MKRPSEAETEAEFIYPILSKLGWEYLPQQEPGKGRKDIADALLFLDESAKAKARRLHQTADRFRLGAVVVENEARDTPLDRASGNGEAPSSQLIRYLIRAETQSDSAVRWGLLTSGRYWRMYWAHARARAEGFVEIDLPALVSDMTPAVPEGADAQHWLRVFLLLFGQGALEPRGVGGQTFLDEALLEGRRYEERITARLSAVVFDHVFPELMQAIAKHSPDPRPTDPVWRASARATGLRLLYRLLFLLYAEDRDLLPVRHEGYSPYSLRGLRDEAASIVDQNRRLSSIAKTWWPRLVELFRAIAKGDASMGLPPYNGRLFDDASAPLLPGLAIPDAVLAPMIDAMSREDQDGTRRWINYRDLSVQHLGSIYERLLEQDVVPDGGTGIALRPNAFSRKSTGSYYTPEELVGLILRRTVGPLLASRREAFLARAEALASDRRPKAERLRLLHSLDPAESFVSLRVCDPAMGSGHFLVSLVDNLADEVLTAITDAPTRVEWGEYRSPLVERLEVLRTRLRQQAILNGWTFREDQLDDRHLVRRIILKRVVYGVDSNPMAVELAKLSLWLHSFTVGAPLSFLDHHLRTGDSLFGEFVGPVERDLHERFGLVMSQAVVKARQSAAGMAMVEGLTDADLAEVRSSAEAFSGVERATSDLRAFLDVFHAGRWLPVTGPAEEVGREAFFGGGYGDPVQIAAGAALKAPKSTAQAMRRRGKTIPPVEAHSATLKFVSEARALAADRHFLHWEAAFPGVWEEWESNVPRGGFDAVIGNPPWDRMKMQEVEWFEARVPPIALAQRASDRKRLVADLRKKRDPISAEYDLAVWTAETAATVAAECGAYPLLSGGDINLYALFVERATRLVRRDGIVGMLVPSGIAADKGASAFFRSVSTTGRLSTLIDFENRPYGPERTQFFPDVYYRFKFCALVIGGVDRAFPAADCAFFQQNVAEAENNAFRLTPQDFTTVNPNTGTAPIFRTRRDAEITREVYKRLPVLVDRRTTAAKFIWPIEYATMFHMTNDSAKFRTAQELVREGAYPVPGGRWEKGDLQWLPLYEGKMVQAYDHRAASIVLNPANVNRPAQQEPSSDGQRADPGWSPRPQFWVSRQDVALPENLSGLVAFKDITSPTNARTMIAAMIPPAACGNTLPLLLPDKLARPGSLGDAESSFVGDHVLSYREFSPLLLANLNAFALDFIARQKVQGNHLNFYIIEQLPLVPRDGFSRRFGPRTAEEIVREDVLRLTYTAKDMTDFARDQGYVGPPFGWDEEDRLRRRARLDAVFFHLYGLDGDTVQYVLGTFHVIQREEEERHAGRFRSRDLILGYMAALAAGKPDAPIAG